MDLKVIFLHLVGALNQICSKRREVTTSPARRGDGLHRTAMTSATASASAETTTELLDAATVDALKLEVKKRGRAQGTKPTPKSAGVLYLGHIPHGFYEEQMRGFFSQFGKVTRLRLARNKRTGKSKHFAFVEFAHRDVCEIVAKAMNGYLLFSKVLVAKVMDPAQVHPETFKNADKPFKVRDRQAIERKKHNTPRGDEEAERRTARLAKADSKKRKRLEAAGIDYDFDGYDTTAAKAAKQPKSIKEKK